jgi:site-specific DNA-cytosine methylase
MQFLGGFTATAERIGNSVPPLFMRAIAEHIRDTILVPSVKEATA